MKPMVVMLKFVGGDWATGFSVTLQIGPEGEAIATEVQGFLPADRTLRAQYQTWQTHYQTLHESVRIAGLKKSIISITTPKTCLETAKVVQTCFQNWLASESFRSIREMWLEKLTIAQEIRVILQTDDIILQGLPWHSWDLLERYPGAELALAAPMYEQVETSPSDSHQVKILAILGNSQGIDTQVDLQVLNHLSDVSLQVLQEPTRSQLSDALWDRHWDILFFAGHSVSDLDRMSGKIYINQNDGLTLNELKYALQRSVQQGLHVAIFNSCDGLGLAHELSALKIPELIVMRESVPDRVAQEFLKYFLTAFAQGESLYLSVRHARERLQAIEGEFPCATWLPMLFQNPAYVPPTWRSLMLDKPLIAVIQNPPRSRRKFWVRQLGIGIASGGLAIVLQWLGLLQNLDYYAYDRLMMVRPAESTDDRILVITIDETDLKNQAKRGLSSLSDEALNQLLTRLQTYEPYAIGLDIYRDFPVTPPQKQLQNRLKTTDHFIAICKTSTPESPNEGVEPPPEVPIDRVGFSDFLRDSDGILRRQLMFMNPAPTSPCQASYGFATRIAIEYLLKQDMAPSFTPEGALKIGQVVLPNLARSPGIYRYGDTRGGQMLLNYRTGDRPFQQVSLTQILQGQIKPELIKNRVILIGLTAVSSGDLWSTPLGTSSVQPRHGVFIQAQMTSQIIHHVLDHRPLMRTYSIGIESLWILTWAMTPLLFLVLIRKLFFNNLGLRILILFTTTVIAIIGCSYWLLLYGNLLPIVSPIVAIGTSAIVVICDRRTLSQPLVSN